VTTADARWVRASVMARSAVWPPGDGGGRTAAWWSWLLVAAAVGWNLASLRALTVGVAYLNDSSLHEQMVRFATSQLRAGHLPLTSWFPFLGEGSPQFLHYQSLPAILSGALGLLIGPDVAFRWSLYLLLSLWPISVYLSARAFGAGRPAAAASAAMAPFLVSATGVGYEQHAYVWTGFGVWTQLWASWTLPLAWGYSWRAIRDGRGYLKAVLLTALTVALHFETGYLALSVLLIWPLVAGRPLPARLRRAAVLLAGSLLTAAWVIAPLLQQREWAAVNEPLQHTGLVDGYGARQVLDWLISGQLLDHGRLPVVTVLAAVGFGLAWLAWSSDTDARAMLVALAVCLVLAFGHATFGSLIDMIPGSTDLFFRRFMMGGQLAALLLAGRGAAWLAAGGVRLLKARIPRWPPRLSPAAGLLAAIVVLAPAWLQLGAYDHRDAAAIRAQQRADDTDGAQLDRLIAVIKRDGGGRTYAGMPSNWGQNLTVGAVPVFKYLDSRDVDEVGYTLRTASLMTDPEYDFDERNPSDYQLFAIHYLIIPTGKRPPVPAALKLRAGAYSLWTLPGATGYVQAGTIVGHLTANRTDIATRTLPVLHSDLAQRDRYEQVRFDQSGSGVPARSRRSSTLPPPRRSAGTVVAQADHLTLGRATATVAMHRPGVVVLSASFDPGWTATVDGHSQPTKMIAPALVATTVKAGTHHVVFNYHGFREYPLLLAVSAATLLTLLCTDVARPHTPAPRKRRRFSPTAPGPTTPQAKPAPEKHERR
jgi:Bacterial membrane protein YfhO